MVSSLASFFEAVNKKIILSFGSHDFDVLQVSLLEDSFKLYQKGAESSVFGSSIFVFSLVLKTWKKEFDEQAQLLGVFCALYVLALDLFDDVQDNDLKGKPYEKVGVPIAVNNAITLLFLSLEFLVKAIELEKDNEKKLQYLKVLNEASLLAVKGQHKDLMGIDGAKTTQDVLEMQKAKGSSVSLMTKCATIFSDCNEEQIKKYQTISEQMVLIFQIIDDIKDIYGKKLSPDLLTNKITYPIACFLESATREDIFTFNELKKELPNSMREIRDLIYNSATIKKASETIETLRKSIHKELASMNSYTPSVRIILYIIDSLASSIYKVPFLKETQFILQPNGGWYSYVETLENSFFDNMKIFNPPQKPILLPWHSPQWMYDPKRNIIFYSDIEGQPEEILPIHSEFMGITNMELVKEIVKMLSPLLMAHEIFHYWRKKSGKLTKDYWYEEWVANILAIAYTIKFSPDLLNETKLVLKNILSNKKENLSNKGKEILDRFFELDYNPSPNILGYEVDLNEMNLIQLYMINKLCKQDFCLEENIRKFL